MTWGTGRGVAVYRVRSFVLKPLFVMCVPEGAITFKHSPTNIHSYLLHTFCPAGGK